MQHIFNPCFCLNLINCGSRAIDPSSFRISQITAEGSSPAIRARSTEASVCPARRSTPPALACSGKICPGCTKSEGCPSGFASNLTVKARSFALIPVLIFFAASTDTVKSVEYISRLCATMRCSPNCLARASVMGAQTKPRPWIVMKLIAAIVALLAAITRSPSFSRSASSVTITMRPLRISAMTSGMESK